MRLFRKIIFFLFLAIYCVVCPWMILYSLGYIYNPLNQKMTSTGVISISTIPSGADVYLGNRHYTYYTPTLIDKMLPGNYNLGLKLKGYKNWTQEISVVSGEALTFENIFLIPQEWSRQVLLPKEIDMLMSFNRDDLLIFKTGSQLKNYFSYELKSKKVKPLLVPGSALGDLGDGQIFNDSESSQFFVTAGPFWGKKYILFRYRHNKFEVMDLTRLISGKFSAVTWDPENEDTLLIVYHDDVDIINVKDLSVRPKYAVDIDGYGLYKQRFYSISDNNIFRLAYDKPTAEKEGLSELLKSPRSEVRPASPYEIKFLKDGIVLFLNITGSLHVNLDSVPLVERGLVGFAYNKDKNILVYWTKNMIKIARFSVSEGKDVSSRYAIKTETLYKDGRDIQKCVWVRDGNHLLFTDNGQLFFLEIEPYGSNHIEAITTLKNHTDIYYSEKYGVLYYLDERTGHLSQLQIMPQEGFFARTTEKTKS
ncbi:MAG: PEGA domain-containing protein [Candidatus Omnitrophica bacterium]|nr:PEGA domain-containing protein [Candidatus Omnitrophota bacterium]